MKTERADVTFTITLTTEQEEIDISWDLVRDAIAGFLPRLLEAADLELSDPNWELDIQTVVWH